MLSVVARFLAKTNSCNPAKSSVTVLFAEYQNLAFLSSRCFQEFVDDANMPAMSDEADIQW
jgi:hypothetical protein